LLGLTTKHARARNAPYEQTRRAILFVLGGLTTHFRNKPHTSGSVEYVSNRCYVKSYVK